MSIQARIQAGEFCEKFRYDGFEDEKKSLDYLKERYPEVNRDHLSYIRSIFYSSYENESSLTLEQFAAVKLYTNSYYEEINRALRFGEKREEYNLLIEDLFCSIKQLSKKNKCNNENGDPLYRGTGSYYEDDFTEGSTIIFSGFTSTSTNISITIKSYFKENRGYLLYIFGHSCADISSISIYPSEKEVLFSNSTKFKVLCKHGEKVVLEEENTTYNKGTAGHVNILPDLNEKNKALALCDELIER